MIIEPTPLNSVLVPILKLIDLAKLELAPDVFQMVLDVVACRLAAEYALLGFGLPQSAEHDESEAA